MQNATEEKATDSILLIMRESFSLLFCRYDIVYEFGAIFLFFLIGFYEYVSSISDVFCENSTHCTLSHAAISCHRRSQRWNQ
jgi:hypothetical protein